MIEGWRLFSLDVEFQIDSFFFFIQYLMVVFYCFLTSNVSYKMLLILLYCSVCVVFFCGWAALRIFCLSLVFSSLPTMCLGIVLIWEVFSHDFYTSFFFPFSVFCDFTYMCSVRTFYILQVFEGLFIYFFSVFFFLCGKIGYFQSFKFIFKESLHPAWDS